jgi:hypothetical protein
MSGSLFQRFFQDNVFAIKEHTEQDISGYAMHFLDESSTKDDNGIDLAISTF